MKTFELNDYQNAYNITNDENIKSWKKEDYPYPSNGRKPSSVSDPDRVLSEKEGK